MSGVSASGELALAMGLGHPGIYGAVFCASPGGGYRPPAVMPGPLPRRIPRRRHARAVFLKNATRCRRTRLGRQSYPRQLRNCALVWANSGPKLESTRPSPIASLQVEEASQNALQDFWVV